MRNLGYNLVKWWIKAGLHLYYGKIKIVGLENVPKNKPVLFLPNHQSALIDVLLIAVDCNRKPYFLTRSDIFKGGFLNSVFKFFQMIPIYRIRDGRESLKNNQAVFDTCADLLEENQAILMFPEANHNVQRRIRPLSKGFTRILFNALERNPELDIQIVPIGINYRNSISFPDKVALYFDKPILVNVMYESEDVKASVDFVKETVSGRMKKLTTHIPDETTYENTSRQLEALQVDYLNPSEVNEIVAVLKAGEEGPEIDKNDHFLSTLFRALFMILNFPVVLLWKILLKPQVWEPEFTGTLRFGFSLLIYPVYYLFLFAILAWMFTPLIASVSVLGLFLFNWAYVRCH